MPTRYRHRNPVLSLPRWRIEPLRFTAFPNPPHPATQYPMRYRRSRAVHSHPVPSAERPCPDFHYRRCGSLLCCVRLSDPSLRTALPPLTRHPLRRLACRAHPVPRSTAYPFPCSRATCFPFRWLRYRPSRPLQCSAWLRHPLPPFLCLALPRPTVHSHYRRCSSFRSQTSHSATAIRCPSSPCQCRALQRRALPPARCNRLPSTPLPISHRATRRIELPPLLSSHVEATPAQANVQHRSTANAVR